MKPLFIRSNFISLSSRTCSIAFASSSVSKGLIRSAPSPTTSGMEDTLDVIVGVPQQIASRAGSPKPS